MSDAAMVHGPAAEPRWSDLMGPRGALQMAVAGSLIAWLYFDQIVRMMRIWTDELDWSHGFLIAPFCVYLVHSRRDQLARFRPRPSWFGLPVILAGIAVYFWSIRAKIGYPQPMSMLVVLAGVVLMLAGWRMLRFALLPIGFMVLAVPPPDYRYKQLTQPLQQFAAWISEAILSTLPDVTIVRNGIHMTAIDAAFNPIAQFTVQGACSGMRSLLAFTALGMAMAFITPRPAWQRLVMAVVVIPVALFCNSIRVVVTGVLLIYQMADWAKGTPHMVLGLLTFGLGLLMYSAVLFVMDHLFVEVTDESDDDQASGPAVENT